MTAHTGESLRAVARYHRWINLCILAQIVAYAVSFGAAAFIIVDSNLMVLLLQLGSRLIRLAAVVFSIVSVFLLTRTLGGTVLAVLAAITQLIPCVGLIVLAVLSNQAQAPLRKAGVSIGLLGADPNSIPDQPADVVQTFQ